MPDFNVIANVSETLLALLDEALAAVDPIGGGNTAPIAILHDLHNDPAPPDNAAGVLAVTLVETREDGASRNRPRVRRPHQNDPTRVNISKPPVALMLRYVLTPWSRSSGNGNSREERLLEHRMLGRVAQHLYDGAILSGNQLRGQGDLPNGSGLQGSTESLKINLAPLSFEEQTRFWNVVNGKYRASLTYDVRVVNLDPIKSQNTPLVSSQEFQYGKVDR